MEKGSRMHHGSGNADSTADSGSPESAPASKEVSAGERGY